MIIRKILVTLVASGLAFSGVAIAQDDDHGLINVRTTYVKPGRGQEYQELMGQLAASRKAAGHSGVAMYQVIRGRVGTFYTVTSVDDYAGFSDPFDSGMSDGDWQRWIGRITDTIDHSVVSVLRTHGDLAIVPDSDTPPNMFQLRFTELEVGHGADYHDWVENSPVPALRAGNTTGWTISEVRMGDDINTWVSARRIDSWADLDGPAALAHMSQRERTNMLAERGDMVRSARVELIRILPELSY